MHSSVCSSLMYSWLVSLPHSVLYDVLLLNTLRVHALEIPRPYGSHSDDCNQTWPGSGTRECVGFGVLERLWQTSGLDSKVQIWPILSCVVRRFLCPKSAIKIHTYLYRWSGNILVSFCILFHWLLQIENTLPQFGVS